MKWFIFTRGTIHPHRVGAPMRAVQEESARLNGFPLHTIFYANVGDKLWWCWDNDEIVGLSKQMLAKFRTKADWRKHFKTLRRFFDKAIASAERIRALNLKKFSNDGLVKLYKEHYEGCKEAHALMNTDVDAIDIYPVEHLRELIQKSLPAELPADKASEVLTKLTSPAHTSYITDEEVALLKIVVLAKNGASDSRIKKALQRVFEKYWWTSLGWEVMKPKSFSDFESVFLKYRGEIREPEKEILKLQNTPKAAKRKRDLLAKRYKIPKEALKLMKLFDEYTFYHDLRKEMQVRTTYSSYLLLTEAAKRLNLNRDDLEWLLPDEVCGLLQGKMFDGPEIERRKKAVVILVTKGGMKTISGEKALELKKRELDENVGEVSEIKGTCASSGKVTAVVKVCNGAQEALDKVKQGDILVTGMTLPDYVPAMRRAAAIITDEGGITCHAAIISRELKIPCVIGTKIATRVLKDGMTVEVDANKGTVKILKKS